MNFEDIKSATALKLTDEQKDSAAAEVGLTRHHINAILAVESGGSGFFTVSRRPKILFEAHLFAKLTSQKYNTTNPKISSAKWNKALYSRKSEDEYLRLKEAMTIDPQAALKSASYGLFQILGMNFRECGCKSVEEFVQENCKDEVNQLKLFINFLKSKKLIDKMKALDWAGVAKVYNGPGYAANKYDTKLAEAYNRSIENS